MLTFLHWVYIQLPKKRIGVIMATARIERNIARNILNLVDAIDVRATAGGTWGFDHLPTSSTFGATTIPAAQPHGDASAHASTHGFPLKHEPTGNPMPGQGNRVRAERRAILQRSSIA